jgi:cyclopropane fatty-acyl-phospholipid synthase-like methyltransferase
MEQRDHHDWSSDTYVEEWVNRQQVADPARAERFQLMCDLFPFSTDATVTILDLGAGYGPVSKFILDQFPHATCIAQDGSTPMLQRAQQRMARYGARFTTCQSDLFDTNWLPQQFGPFDAAVSASCLHNLRDFPRISAIYRDIRAHLKPGGVFLNFDLLNAPTVALQQHYGRVAAAQRQREGAPRAGVDAMVQRARQTPVHGAAHSFPANLDEHLAALRAAGFTEVDCFWKDLRRALYGGYA